jgi:hypothetical protein
MNKKGIKKYLPGAESLTGLMGSEGMSGAGNIGGAIGSAASSLMPLLMKKPDPNAKPYKKGSNLVKYQEGNEALQTSKLGRKAFEQLNAEPRNAEVKPIATKKANIKLTENISSRPTPQMVKSTGGMSFDEQTNMLPEDLLSKKDRMISKLPKFLQKTLAGKAKRRIDAFQKDYNSAKAELGYGDDLSELNENRLARKIVSNRKNRPTSGEIEELSKKSNYTPEEYPETFETKKGKMGSAITFGDEYGPGRKEYVGQLRANKKKDLQARLDGIEARAKYEAEEKATKDAIASGIPASLNAPTFSKESIQRSMEKQTGGPVSTEKNPILYKEEPQQETKQSSKEFTQVARKSNPYIAFKNMSAADQKLYRAGMASGGDFKVGDRDYKAAVPKQRMHSDRMQRLFEKNPDMYNKLITKTSKFQKGTKEVKAENPIKILKGKNGALDTSYNTKTGRKIAFIPKDAKEEKPEKEKTVVKTETKAETKTTTPKSTENKGLYQGNKTAEFLTTGGLPAVAEVVKSNPTSGRGRTIKNLIKYAPAVGRFVHDVIADKKNKGEVDWVARGGNFVKDVGIGTAATGTVKTARGARKSYKEQESAAAKETENPIAPSRKEALKVGANEAVDKSTAAKLPKKAITYVKDFVGNSPEGKAAKINLAHKSAKDTKYTGVGNNKVGKENEFYIKGNSVDEKTYKASIRKEGLTGRRKTLSLSTTSPKEQIKKVKTKAEEIEYKKLAIQHAEKVNQKALDEKFTGIGNSTVGKQDKYYIDGVEVPDRTYHAKYKGEIKEQKQTAEDVYKTSKKEDKNVIGPKPEQPTPLRKDVINRQRAFSDVEEQKKQGFTEAKEFKEHLQFETNKINSRTKPDWMSDEDFATSKQKDLNALEETRKAFAEGYKEKLKEKSAKREAAKNPSTEESKTESKTETVPPKKERASRAAGANKPAVNDLTDNKRVTETTETTKNKKGSEPSNTSKEGSGPTDGPTLSAEQLGVVGKKKRGQKANGARLIKYK